MCATLYLGGDVLRWHLPLEVSHRREEIAWVKYCQANTGDGNHHAIQKQELDFLSHKLVAPTPVVRAQSCHLGHAIHTSNERRCEGDCNRSDKQPEVALDRRVRAILLPVTLGGERASRLVHHLSRFAEADIVGDHQDKTNVCQYSLQVRLAIDRASIGRCQCGTYQALIVAI